MITLVLALALVQDDEATYVDRALGFQIAIPAGWSLERHAEAECCLSMYPTERDNDPTTIQIFIHEANRDLLSGATDVESYLKQLKKRYSRALEDFELLGEPSCRRRGDNVVVALQYQCQSDGAACCIYELQVFTRKRLFQFVATTTEGKFERHLPLFKSVSRSFRCAGAASAGDEDPSANYGQLLKELRSCCEKKRYEEGIAIGVKAICAKADNYGDAYHLLSQCCFFTGKYDDAGLYAWQAMESLPDNDVVVLDCLEVLMCSGHGDLVRTRIGECRQGRAFATARYQALFDYLAVASFCIDHKHPNRYEGFERLVERFAQSMEKMGGGVGEWDASATEAFVGKIVKSPKSKKFLGIIHQLLKGEITVKQYRKAMDQAMWE